MSRLRILMTADAVGGVWQYSTELARALSADGIDVRLAVLGPSPTPCQREMVADISGIQLVDTGLPLDWLAADRYSLAAAGRAIAHLADEHDVDLVHLNTPALACGQSFSVPVVAVFHSCVASWWDAVHGGALPNDFRWRTEMLQQGLRAADRVIAPSAAIADQAKRLYGLLRVPEVIPNGRTPIVQTPGARHDFAFTAGRLWDEGKNLHTLDRAAACLAIPFRAAGPTHGPAGGEIKFRHLHALGELSEPALAQWLAAQPVFVSAARYEPFGLAVLEAAQAGCPLVLSDIPTFRELWDGAAMFVAPDDAAGFAAAVDSLIGDGARRLALGQAARERAERYSVDAMASKMRSLYARLVRTVEAPPAVTMDARDPVAA